MSDHIARVAEVLDRHFTERDEDSGCARRCGYDGDDRADHIARALDAAGLLNDRKEVQRKAIKASRLAYEAAREAIDNLESDLDAIEREAGECDE